ncbi:hypothetical protein AB86_5085 [Escherichia coli 2-177-06_S3_C1]|nr:hypothetical protein AB86_5085 [Escherichia coli 2-177-06_S3_C1]
MSDSFYVNYISTLGEMSDIMHNIYNKHIVIFKFEIYYCYFYIEWGCIYL